MRNVCLALALCLGACSSDGMMMMGGDDDGFLPGFDVPPPEANQLQFATPVLQDVTPGEDITLCTYLDVSLDQDWDITDYKGYQTVTGHHAILYAAVNHKPAGTHECTEDDMFNVRYLAGGGSDTTASTQVLPPGIAFRVKSGTQIMLLSHWINSTDMTVPVQAAFNVTVQPPSTSVEPADLFVVANTQFQVGLGHSTVPATCTLQQDLKFFLISGHAHEHATHLTIQHKPVTGSPETIFDIDWAPELIFDSPLNHYTKDDPYVMHTGDTFELDCTYDNTTGQPIPFPSEMCVGYGFYFPATRELDCVDGYWPQGS